MPRGERQERKRRGRYDKSEKVAPPSKVMSESEFNARISELSALYLAAVKTKVSRAAERDHEPGGATKPEKPRDWTAAESSALHLAQLEVHNAHLLTLEAARQLTADEVKSLPAVSREIRAVRAELGLATFNSDGEPIESDEEDDG